MSQPAAPSKPTSTIPNDPTPPDERFWIRYSPHYEFPLSTIGSIAIHVFAIVVFFLLLRYAITREDKTPVIITPMAVDGVPGGIGEGGGEPGDPGGGDRTERKEQQPDQVRPRLDDVQLAKPKEIVKEWVPNLREDPEAMNALSESEAFEKFAQLGEKFQEGLIQGNNKPGPPGVGPGGPGGPGDGPGGTGGEKTARRKLRWTLNFTTRGGQDYINQLKAMDAIIWVPRAPNQTEDGIVIRDLSNPREHGRADFSEYSQLIAFYDDRRESVASVAQVLGLNFTPPMFFAFFPPETEIDLAKKELAYSKRQFGNTDEKNITSTTFQVVFRGGQYEIRVTNQKVLRRK